jgi:hypothetical protein
MFSLSDGMVNAGRCVHTVAGGKIVPRQGCSALAQTGKQTIRPFNWLSPLVCDSLATSFSLTTM